jgi:hypothetical protein
VIPKRLIFPFFGAILESGKVVGKKIAMYVGCINYSSINHLSQKVKCFGRRHLLFSIIFAASKTVIN